MVMKKKSMIDLGRVSTAEYKGIKKLPIVVMLEDVRSEMNVGNIFRTADAFLIESIVLCGITSCPPRAEIHKTALGAEDSVEWHYYESGIEAVKKLRDNGYKIYSIEQVHDSISLEQFDMVEGEKIAVIFGNEVKGVSQDVVDASDGCIEIPQYGTKHSLNVANSASIVMWELLKRFALKNG